MRKIAVGKTWFRLGVFLPLLAAMFLIVAYGFGWNTFALLNRVEGNTFVINDVLFLLIVASYGVVFIGLLFALLGTGDDLFAYKGVNASIKKLDKASLVILIGVCFLLFIYLGMMCAALFGLKSLGVETLILVNRWCSLLIFTLFLTTDWLSYRSKKLQHEEICGDKKAAEPKSELEFYELAILLIDVPALTLSALMIWLVWYVSENPVFKGVIDRDLNFFISSDLLNLRLFSLFIHGIETGVIASIIIFSQAVYLVLRSRCGNPA